MRTIVNFCKALMRDPLLWGACALLVAGALMPALVPSMTYGLDGLRSEIEQQHASLAQHLGDGSFYTAPDDMRTLLRARNDCMEEALAATDNRSFYKAAAELAQLSVEMIQRGYLSYDKLMAEADYEYARALADYGEAAPASSTSGLTLFEGATVSVACLPSAAWFLPVLVLAARALTMSRERHLFEAPTRPAGRRAALVFAPLAAGAVAIPPAAIAPALALFGIRNSVGGAGQPITYVVGGDVKVTTTGAALGLTLLFIVLGGLFLAALAALLFRLTARPAVGVAGAALVAALPMFPGYFDASGPLAGVVALLPSTYCAPASFIPSAGNAAYFVMQCQADIDPAAGAAGLLAGTALLVAASALVDKLAPPRLMPRRRKVDPC